MKDPHVYGILKSHAQSGSQILHISCSPRPFPAHPLDNSLKENVMKSTVHVLMGLHTVMGENKMAICAWAQIHVQCLFLSKDIKDIFIYKLFSPFIQIGFSRKKWLWSPLILIFHTEIHFTELEATEMEPSASFSVTWISKCNADWKLNARDKIAVLITQ